MRFLKLLVVGSLALNLWANLLIGTGIAADIGLDGRFEVGGDDAAGDAAAAVDDVKTGAPTGNTLFGLYNVIATTLGTIGQIAFAAPTMLSNLGIPGAFTDMLGVLISVTYAIGIIEFLRGV
jgi:hypothetical protein